MIGPDVRDAAKALLLSMNMGARGVDLRERTMRLLYALGDQTAEPPRSPADAARMLLSMMVATKAMPADLRVPLERAGMGRLQALVTHLGGSIKVATLSDGSARLYAVVLCLARVDDGLLQ